MRAGTLRHRVTIQRYELVVDDYGAPLHRESWKDVATVWASVEAVSGRDFFAARQEQSEVTHKVTIRYRGDVTAQMRVLHGGKVLGIVASLPDNRNTRLVLMCREASYEQEA